MPCCLRLLAIRVAPSTSLMLFLLVTERLVLRDYALMAGPRQGVARGARGRAEPRLRGHPDRIHVRALHYDVPVARRRARRALGLRVGKRRVGFDEMGRDHPIGRDDAVEMRQNSVSERLALACRRTDAGERQRAAAALALASRRARD